MSMVERMMEGVVRKNSTKESVKLMPSHWDHQWKPWTDRFFLQRREHGLWRLLAQDPATSHTKSAPGLLGVGRSQ